LLRFLEHRSISEWDYRHVCSGYVDAIRQLKHVIRDKKTRFFNHGWWIFIRRGNFLRFKTGNRVGGEGATVWKESRKLNLKWYALVVERESNERTRHAARTAWFKFFFSFLNQTGSVRFGLTGSGTQKPETKLNRTFF
jgi:hypothetical protein